MFKTFTCGVPECGRMFTFPTAYKVPMVNGKPAHPSCFAKHKAHKRMVAQRIEYLISLQPTTEEESLMVQKELSQLTKAR